MNKKTKQTFLDIILAIRDGLIQSNNQDYYEEVENIATTEDFNLERVLNVILLKLKYDNKKNTPPQESLEDLKNTIELTLLQITKQHD